jgi:hypothetical protein
MTPLNWIVNEAKKLKKQFPHRFKKWTDYVAQASAIYASKHKGKSPVGKKHKVSPVKKKTAKKKTGKVGYSKLRLKNDKELTKAIKNEPDTLFPYTHKQRLVLAAKKHYDKLNRDIHKVSGAKKKAAKKSPARMLHKDTKSHNVNIRVMSGVRKSDVDFWINMFAPRKRSLQLQWYRELVSSFKFNHFNPFTSKEKGEAQLRALEYILNKKPLIIK